MNFLDNRSIDKKRWDTAVKNAISPKPFALSTWLDAVSPGWSGFVQYDYRSVFPVTLKRSPFRPSVYQPPFSQQLGLFYSDENELSGLIPILEQLQSKYKKGYLQLNDANWEDGSDFNHRRNYILDFESVDTLELSESHRRNLKKASAQNLKFEEIDIKQFWPLLKKHNPVIRSIFLRNLGLGSRMKKAFKDDGFGRSVVIRKDDDILAGVAMPILNETAYHLLPFTTDTGRKMGAMHFLILQLNTFYPNLKRYDFEGSELEGVERFIKGFDARLVPYPTVSW